MFVGFLSVLWRVRFCMKSAEAFLGGRAPDPAKLMHHRKHF